MANGDIHKLGTLYVANTKRARPTRPWYSTNGSAPSTGNLLDYANSSSNSVEIKDTDSNEAYQLQWIEVNDGSDKILICDRNLLMNIAWNRLNVLGFCGAKGKGKTITIDGKQYELFMLSGGKSSLTQTETEASNEWDKYIGNLGEYSGLQTPQAQDLQNSASAANFSTAHNKSWNWAGCYSWCRDTKDGDSSKRTCRGNSGARNWGCLDSSEYNNNVAWRPILRTKNEPAVAPIIASPVDGERRTETFYVEFNIGADPEGDTQTFKIQTANDLEMTQNLKEFSQIEKKTDNGWTRVTSASNEDLKNVFRINVTGMSGDKYIRVVATDAGSGMNANSTTIHVRIGTVMEVQTRPQDTEEMTEKAVVLLGLTADEKVTKEIWVANNANDDSPTWEAYTPDSDGNHVFSNKTKTANKWAVATKVRITANNSTEEISLQAIGMGVL